MSVRRITDNIYAVGVNHWDRRLFDELIPLPDGTSYNSYLIQGTERTALIDSSDTEKCEEFFQNLDELQVKKIDYIVANHAEQDHSGCLPLLIKKYPQAKIVTNEKCSSFLKDLLLLPEDKFLIIQEGDTVSLGGRTLEFFITPWVHWPETMLTYLKEDKILFPCDLFGSHLATSDLYSTDEHRVYESAKRYFAEIMMPFRSMIQNHLKKIEKLDIVMIAPSHGPVHKRPEFIINAYQDWISDNVKNEVLIPYVSMHHSTKRMVDFFIDQLINKGITVKPFNLTVTDVGELAIALVDAATIVLGTPTVLAGPHPSAVYGTYLVNALRPKTKFISVIGSYGWGGKTLEIITGMITNLKAEVLSPVMIKGYPTTPGFQSLAQLADTIEAKHKELKIL